MATFKERLDKYKAEDLISEKEYNAAITNKTSASLRTRVRAKMSLIVALEQNPTILLIDSTLDTIAGPEGQRDDTNTSDSTSEYRWLKYLLEWSKKDPGRAVIIASKNAKLRHMIQRLSGYQNTIEIGKDENATITLTRYKKGKRSI